MSKETSLRVLINTVKNISLTKSFPVGRVVVVAVGGGGGVGSSVKMPFSRSVSNAYKWSSGQMTVGHESLVGI